MSISEQLVFAIALSAVMLFTGGSANRTPVDPTRGRFSTPLQ